MSNDTWNFRSSDDSVDECDDTFAGKFIYRRFRRGSNVKSSNESELNYWFWRWRH